MRPGRQVQAVAQLLAGLEERDVLLRDLDAVAGARVAADPKPRSSTRSPRASAAVISSKMAVTIASTSRW
jgi:hypothetical protein